MGELIEGLKDVTEFLNDAFDACKDHTLVEAVAQSLPWWIAGTVQGLAESLPVVGFIAKQAATFFQPDAEGQGRIACTLAYQRSFEQALTAINLSLPEKLTPRKVAKRTTRKIEDAPIAGFKFDASALGHPFITISDIAVREFAENLGLDQGQTNSLITSIHGLFLNNLTMILSHPQTEAKFKNFARLVAFEAEGQQGRRALALHNQYTLWRYERARVLGDERFALTHVYTETDCGELLWKEIAGPTGRQSQASQERTNKNPFSEQDAERKPLLKTVLDLIGKKGFREPIVIQGAAGVGKSTFTLRLAVELMREGFIPIRVELGDVDISRPIDESLPKALRFSHAQFPTEGWDPEISKKEFETLVGSNESIPFGQSGTLVSPYVLILDGWDEITTGTSSGFRDDVEKMLNEVRTTFFGAPHRNVPQIHVVITGRPTMDVTRNKLLHDDTPILTVRPFSPDQLATAVERFLKARKKRPLPSITPEETESGTERITPFGKSLVHRDREWFEPVIQNYRDHFSHMLREHQEAKIEAELSGTMAVLGLPLLAQLALRLMANLDSKEQVVEIVTSPCTLYRALIDMTHEQGGKSVTAELSRENRHRLTGRDLRPLLWDVAQAITAMGKEEISREELKLRLAWDKLNDSFDLDEKIEDATKDNVLSRLVISFFLKEGKEQGCRFLHKSFREYLFAEGVVEQLKNYGRQSAVAQAYQDSPANGLRQRDIYWKDFGVDDPRTSLVHGLAKTWATSWVTREIQQYLIDLLSWEIQRSVTPEKTRWSGQPTEPLAAEAWRFVRDGLADTWDWWAEAVPFRCSPKATDNGIKLPHDPFIVRLTRLCSPLDPDRWKGKDQELPNVTRITTVDSRLGDAFFLLNSVVHAEIIDHQRTNTDLALTEPHNRKDRRYQSFRSIEQYSVVRFRPTGEDSYYFLNFIARINAAGWRPQGLFPESAIMRGIDFHKTQLFLTICTGSNFKFADLKLANLYKTILTETNFSEADLSNASLAEVNLFGSNLTNANLNEADLSNASLREVNLRNANLTKANLYEADLRTSNLNWANLDGANLYRTNLYSANLSDANLRNANLNGANLNEANLYKANLNSAELRHANLRHASLRDADLSGAYLDKANLSETDLRGADLRGARVSRKQIQSALIDSETLLPDDLDNQTEQ